MGAWILRVVWAALAVGIEMLVTTLLSWVGASWLLPPSHWWLNPAIVFPVCLVIVLIMDRHYGKREGDGRPLCEVLASDMAKAWREGIEAAERGK